MFKVSPSSGFPGWTARRPAGVMSKLDRFDRIVESLHAATLDETCWRATSMLIQETCGITATQLLTVAGRPNRSHGWRSDQVEMIQRLLPHIRQFVRVREALAGARALNTSLAGVVDNTMVGVIGVDRRGKIVQANSVARAVLRHSDSLMDRDGYLRAPLPADDARLRGLLSHALSPSAAPCTPGSMVIRRPSELPRLMLHVTPVVAHDIGFGSSHIGSMVLIVDPAAQSSFDPEHVAAVLGLTPAESRVAVALTAGATAREIAAATSRREATVRELLKRVHVKLGISRRADLVRTVLTAREVPGPRR